MACISLTFMHVRTVEGLSTAATVSDCKSIGDVDDIASEYKPARC